MGSLIGHVMPGLGFAIVGFWHLYNHLKLYFTRRHRFSSLPWFSSTLLGHLELYLIMFATAFSIAMELFLSPHRHHPFDPDGTIPSNHLHNFEHSSISLSFFIYAAFAIALDRFHPNPMANSEIVQLVGAMAFVQELLMFHLHSTDHMGVEGQYHWLLQLVISVSLSTTILGIAFPRSFINSYLRSLSILFQGMWLVVMGFMLWTPSLIPKGCFMNLEEGHMVVRCNGEESLHRAKSLVNIQFSWFLILLAVIAVSFYILMGRIYRDKVDYVSVMAEVVEDGDLGAAEEHKGKTHMLMNSGKAIDHMER